MSLLDHWDCYFLHGFRFLRVISYINVWDVSVQLFVFPWWIFSFSRYNFREYKEVFTGLEMCDWLTEVGLVHDRGEAVKYGRTLLIGRVIAHVKNEHHFHDLPYFYFFLDDEEAVLLSITENTWDVESDVVNLIIYLITLYVRYTVYMYMNCFLGPFVHVYHYACMRVPVNE